MHACRQIIEPRERRIGLKIRWMDVVDMDLKVVRLSTMSGDTGRWRVKSLMMA